jgi:hypothetical protein
VRPFKARLSRVPAAGCVGPHGPRSRLSIRPEVRRYVPRKGPFAGQGQHIEQVPTLLIGKGPDLRTGRWPARARCRSQGVRSCAVHSLRRDRPKPRPPFRHVRPMSDPLSTTTGTVTRHAADIRRSRRRLGKSICARVARRPPPFNPSVIRARPRHWQPREPPPGCRFPLRRLRSC